MVYRTLPICFLLLAAAVAPACFAAEDIVGASEPVSYPRFPRSWIVEARADDEAQPHEFVVSAVEKIRRELKIERKVRANAQLKSATYQVPNGTPLDSVFEHYRGLVAEDQVLFECAGRDCGRSNQWANQVFGLPILYGPDANQRYLAGRIAEDFVSVYVIQRGNRRIYAHVQLLDVTEVIAVERNAEVLRQLTGRGYAEISGLRPRRDGTLPESAAATLSAVGSQLRVVKDRQIYVVCHLYSASSVPAQLERAQSCADAAAELLREGIGAEAGSVGKLSLIPFAAGPLLPRGSENVSRIELVLPHRQNRG